MQHSNDSIKQSIIKLDGLSCSSCVVSIETILTKIGGVQTVSVTLLPPQACLTFDSSLVDEKTLCEAIQDLGFDVVSIESEPVSLSQIIYLDIEGMTCASCVSGIESCLSSQNGVFDVAVTLIPSLATITYDPSTVGIRDLIELINSIGYEASIHKALTLSNRELKRYGRELMIAFVFVLPAFVVSMIGMMILPPSDPFKKILSILVFPGVSLGDFIMVCLATPVQFGLGYRFYSGAYKSLVYLKTANMDVLVALGTSVAYFFSLYAVLLNAYLGLQVMMEFFETSIFLIFFILLGKYLETYAKGRTSDTIRHLIALTPEVATLVTSNPSNQFENEREISLELVQVGDILKVNPGSRIPTDSIIIRGMSYVDESMLTGESVPIEKSVGSSVLGGTVNTSALIYIKVSQVGSKTTLARIVKMIEHAQSTRAPIQLLSDRISSFFVPIVILIALVTFFGWISAYYLGWVPLNWIPQGRSPIPFLSEFAVAVLVIACPCALGLATPTAVMVGTGVAAEHGILVKGGGAALETAHQVRTIAFDKTGTLTEGTPVVSEVEMVDDSSIGFTHTQVWSVLYSVQSASDHPLAKAVTSHAKEHLMDSDPVFQVVEVVEVVEVPGKGMQARIQVGSGEWTVRIGNQKWMIECGVLDTTFDERIRTLEGSGRTVFLCCAFQNNVKEILAVLGVSDRVRPEAYLVIQALEKLNVQVWMITGDNHTTAKAVGSAVGILPGRILSRVLPENKAESVKYLQRSASSHGGVRSKVAFVGDGINDSVALAQADIGIALGAGTDIAIEAAQVVLVKSDLRDVLILIQISRKCFDRVRMNFAWAIGYNLLGIPIAAGVFYPFFHVALHPWMAGIAMALSSVSVVVSSLLLKTFKPSYTS